MTSLSTFLVLLCVAHHVVLASNLLTVELSAPWKTSRSLEIAAFLSSQASPQALWAFVDLQNKSAYDVEEDVFLKLSLQSGEFAALVQAQSSLSKLLSLRLGLPNHCMPGNSWMALEHGDGRTLSGCQAKDFDDASETTCSVSNERLFRFADTDLVLPGSNTESPLACVVHGDLESPEFHKLLAFARVTYSDTHCVLVRMAAPDSSNRALLGGFSVSLDIKNTECEWFIFCVFTPLPNNTHIQTCRRPLGRGRKLASLE
jgi:hypothetical protein